MIHHHHIAVIMPALNEEQAIAQVLGAAPPWVDQIIVVDNGSTDRTASVARSCGATVVREPRRGYGAACLVGLAALEQADVVVFLDADRSDDPAQMRRLIEPILADEADLVIGSRVLGAPERGSLTWPQRVGNALACRCIRRIWGAPCTDLGPFRAARFAMLRHLAMSDLDYGWTAQMQARAARMGYRITEVPVRYRRRIGRSKISGTVRGVFGAGWKILTTIVREAITRRRRPMGSDRLVVFSRLPIPGTAKTRLIPVLGEVGAAELQHQMTQLTLAVARRWAEGQSGQVEVRFTGGTQEEMARRFGDDCGYVEQGAGDLGERMSRALAEAFASGCRKAVCIGSDCPSLNPAIIRQAFDRLASHDVVLGPATDGGYYLIGLRSRPGAAVDLFRQIDWGTDRVLAQTRQRIRQQGLRCDELRSLPDVDEPRDLVVWQAVRQHTRRALRTPIISVIIPALNEEHALTDAIRSAMQASAKGCVEVIVVDGGSTDATVETARRLGARVMQAPPIRALQMNAGAEAAEGEILLFLHADTRLPFAYEQQVLTLLPRQGVVAGAFRMAFDRVTPTLQLIERGTNCRARWRQMPYGDQAIFLRRETFTRLGAYHELPVMEDYEFIQRLRRTGLVAIAPTSVITSARKYLAHGPWRTVLKHQRMILAWHLRPGDHGPRPHAKPVRLSAGTS